MLESSALSRRAAAERGNDVRPQRISCTDTVPGQLFLKIGRTWESDPSCIFWEVDGEPHPNRTVFFKIRLHQSCLVCTLSNIFHLLNEPGCTGP
ncbi:hypothetical protein SRHO_G00286570 [Serrasalmus rhombeus]